MVRSLAESSVATTRDAYDHWRNVRTVRLGAGLAYYGLFAIVPLLVLAAALVGALISTDDTVAFVRDLIDGIPNIDPGAVA
jgi:uncharacterized BrkB/YihY/UPF0761 family membrane protein